jgi:hypothetical protein
MTETKDPGLVIGNGADFESGISRATGAKDAKVVW